MNRDKSFYLHCCVLASLMDQLESDARAALNALKDAAITRSTKGDWRLVAAAQAIRRGAYSNEFDAAEAMGKPIAQRREVANWLDKLAQLEQRQSQPQPRRSARLLVQQTWIQQHLPGVQLLEPPSPVPSQGGHHAVLAGRSVLAVVTAVHPGDAFIVQSTDWRHPRKFFTQARSADEGAHFRLGKAKITHTESWVTGSVDLVLFDARSGTFTGQAMERVPLFLVNGAGRTASLREAQLVAQAELFRLFQDDLGSELVESALAPLAAATNAEQLASQLSSWPSSIGMEASDEVLEHLLMLQGAVRHEAQLQEFVEGLIVSQHGGVSHEDLCGQQRFPDKLPEPGVTWKTRVLQDYEPDYTYWRICERERNFSGVLRTDYLLW